MVKDVRWRYLIFHLHTPSNPKPENIKSTLKKHLRTFLGIHGLSKSPFKLMIYDEQNKLGIIRCPHTSVIAMRAALALLNNIDGEPSSIHIVKSTGTFKKARTLAKEIAEKLKSHWGELEMGMKKPSQATES
ncbi:MAG: Rpp14/Pop5 family protein [Candidatus Nezhaarchaeales archaeon]